MKGSTKTMPAEKSAEQKILEKAKERFKRGMEAQRDNRMAYEEDFKLYQGLNIWTEDAKRLRGDRPCLEINPIPTYVRQVTNDQRQNRPASKVSPVDDKSDPETAEVLQGLIRHIEYDSNADVAYDTAFFCAVVGGFGFWRILSDYDAEDGFNQSLKIRSIPNALSVVYDPDGIEPDGSDWEWCFVFDKMSKEVAKKKYGDDVCDLDGFDTEQKADGWFDSEDVRVAEYFTFEDGDKVTLYLLENGDVVEKEPADQEYVDAREVRKRKLMWYKIVGNRIVDKREMTYKAEDGTIRTEKYIPIVPVFGDMVVAEGKTTLLSLIRYARDPIRMYNYFRSVETETLALQPKSPWVAANGQIDKYKKIWQTANNLNHSVLPYDPVTINGTLAPPPQRQEPPTMPSAFMQASMNAEKDLMSSIGIHEAGLGKRSNETSGRAIEARQREGDTSTFHFADNMRRSIRHGTRILVDKIPKVYDSERVVRILGEDGSEKVVPLNKKFKEKKHGQEIERIYDLSVGKYDVVATQGASYTSKRQEAADHMVQLMQGNPQIMQTFGDIIFKNMDWPGAEQFAERFKKMLPPELKDMDDDEEGPQIPPELMQQMEMMQAQLQQAEQVMQQMAAELQDKQLENALKEREIAVKEYEAETKRIAAQKPEQMVEGMSEAEKMEYEAQVKAQLQDAELTHKEELAMLDARVKLLTANKDPAIADFDEDLNPVPSQLATDMDAIKQLLSNTAMALNELQNRQNAPKLLERDENGNIIGIKGGARIIRDLDGNIVGAE